MATRREHIEGERRIRAMTESGKFPIWHVTIYLGDLCDVGICMNVTSRSESEAIAEARQIIAVAWPAVYEALHIETMQAIARVVAPCS